VTDSVPPGAHRSDIQVRFADTDALGHLNNASFALYAEHARLDFLRTLGGSVEALILAHLALDFRSQVKYGERIQVLTWVEKVGTTSLTLRQRVLAEERTAADVRSVVVHFDYAAQRPVPIADEVRRRLQPHP
jgi:acyl-CoA thioester hydrolase